MQIKLICLAILSLLSATGVARGDDLADFNAAVEVAASHQRVASGYLRTGNLDVAAIEIERMRAAWSTVTERFAKPPRALAGNPQLYANTLLEISTSLVGASIMADSGRPDAARRSLESIREKLTTLHRANGVAVLADCILDSNGAMDQLMAFNDRALDWNRPGIVEAITTAADRYRNDLVRCDAMAAPDIRNAGEFRRLIDGAQNSIAQIPLAVAKRDADLLHRLLIELRSFDNLLAFRYG